MTHEEPDENSFLELAERFRSSDDPEAIKPPGDELGRIVVGSAEADSDVTSKPLQPDTKGE